MSEVSAASAGALALREAAGLLRAALAPLVVLMLLVVLGALLQAQPDADGAALVGLVIFLTYLPLLGMALGAMVRRLVAQDGSQMLSPPAAAAGFGWGRLEARLMVVQFALIMADQLVLAGWLWLFPLDFAGWAEGGGLFVPGVAPEWLQATGALVLTALFYALARIGLLVFIVGLEGRYDLRRAWALGRAPAVWLLALSLVNLAIQLGDMAAAGAWSANQPALLAWSIGAGVVQLFLLSPLFTGFLYALYRQQTPGSIASAFD